MSQFPVNSRVQPNAAFRKRFPLSAHHKAGTVVVRPKNPSLRGVQWDGLVTWRNVNIMFLAPLIDVIADENVTKT